MVAASICHLGPRPWANRYEGSSKTPLGGTAANWTRDLSRVIQGLVTGIGFLGAGAILKLEDKREIEGLTTAAGIWMTAAMGLAAGLGRFAHQCDFCMVCARRC